MTPCLLLQVFIECSGTRDPSDAAFPTSKFAKLLDRYEHTIKLTVGLPAYVGAGECLSA